MNQPKVKRRVGKYEMGRTIGEGTFAKVKFARNTETGEPVAIKILDKEKVLKHKMAEQVIFLLQNIKLCSFGFPSLQRHTFPLCSIGLLLYGLQWYFSFRVLGGALNSSIQYERHNCTDL